MGVKHFLRNFWAAQCPPVGWITRLLLVFTAVGLYTTSFTAWGWFAVIAYLSIGQSALTITWHRSRRRVHQDAREENEMRMASQITATEDLLSLAMRHGIDTQQITSIIQRFTQIPVKVQRLDAETCGECGQTVPEEVESPMHLKTCKRYGTEGWMQT